MIKKKEAIRSLLDSYKRETKIAIELVKIRMRLCGQFQEVQLDSRQEIFFQERPMRHDMVEFEMRDAAPLS